MRSASDKLAGMSGPPAHVPDPVPVLGVDGARGGWVGARWDGDGLHVAFAGSLSQLLDDVGEVAVVAVDIPIDLEQVERRVADAGARALLGARRSSLFPAPVLGVLDFADDDYVGANRFSKSGTGRGLSKQAWFLVPKIREARALDALHPGLLFETMPELAFRAMHGDVPLPHPKTTWNGLMLRLTLLRRAGIELPDDLGAAGRTAPDDVVDAAALAWSARRIRDGTARRLPVEGPGPAIWW